LLRSPERDRCGASRDRCIGRRNEQSGPRGQRCARRGAEGRRRDQRLAISNRPSGTEIEAQLAFDTNQSDGLAKYYHDKVIGGAGAFVVPIDDFKNFGDAMMRKLVTELAAGVTTSGFPRP
jgi:hypothetical protein